MTTESSIIEGDSTVSKEPYGIIYRITHLATGRCYIGQTIRTLAIRKKAHWMDSKGKNYCSYLGHALRKYGLEAFSFEEIDTADSTKELDDMERYWITFYRTTDRDKGFNIKDGGKNGRPISENRKINHSRKGKKNPSHSVFMKEFFSNPENRIKMSNAKKGQRASKATEFKVGLEPFNKGKPRPKTWREKQSQTYLAKIIGAPKGTKLALQCIETRVVYPGLVDASKATGVNRTSLNRCLRGERKTANKCHWQIIYL